MTTVGSADATARRIREALWGLACGEAVGRWAAAGGAATAGGTAIAGGAAEAASRPVGGGGRAAPDPSALEAGPLVRELAALARAVVAAEGQVDPVALGREVSPGTASGDPAGRGGGPQEGRAGGDPRGSRRPGARVGGTQAQGPWEPAASLALAVRAVLAGLINRPDDVEWLVEDVAALAVCEGGTKAGMAGDPVAGGGPPPSRDEGEVPPAALAAAAAVAAAVSAAVEGDDPESVLDQAVTAASVAVGWTAGRWPGEGGAPRGDEPAAGAGSQRPRPQPFPGDEPAAAVAHAIETLRLTLAGRGAALPPGGIAAVLTSRWEPEPRPARAVPFALVLAAAAGDARRAVLEAAGAARAARHGVAAPATAALAGAVAGALYPGTVPPQWVAALRGGLGGAQRVPLELDALVPELLRLR
ncbi:MAG TPA: hypothetical protein VIL40_05485 [Thermaerobacter sp.]